MATAIIFGATGGIGSALARRVAAEGRYRLVLSGRRAALSSLALSLAALRSATDGVPIRVRPHSG